nr:SPOR domain-containing protein [Aestuariicella hydrocarbonica]
MYRIIPEAELTPPETEGAAAKAPEVEATPVKESATAASKTPTPVVQKQPEPDRNILDAQGLPGAWLVQVASFTQEERAIALRDKLLKDDFPAFTRTLQTSKGKVTRVYVGPKINREKATGLKATLDKSLKIDALIVRFTP